MMVIWFGFHRPVPFMDAIRRREWTMFGHVEAWGATADGAFFHFDPRAEGTILSLTSDPSAFDSAAADRFRACDTVLRYVPVARSIRIPLHPTMNCASQCGHLVGIRAYSPGGLKRILRANGATEFIHASSTGTKGGPGGQGHP